MSVSTTEQLYEFIGAIAIGAAAVLLFDFFRAMRKNNANGKVAVALEDLIFWIFTTIIVAYGLTTFCEGEMRVYWILGMTIGGCVYWVLLSNLIVKIFTFFIFCFKKTFEYLVRIVLFPLIIVCKILRKPVLIAISPMKSFSRVTGKMSKRVRSKFMRQLKFLSVRIKKI